MNSFSVLEYVVQRITLGEPMHWYLSFNKDLSAFFKQIKVCSKMNDDKAKIHLLGK